MSLLRFAWAKVVDVIYPPVCAGCGRRGVWVCDRCRERRRPIAGPICDRCGLPVSSPCACRQLPREIDRFRAAYLYEDWPQIAVHRFKYQDEPARAESLAESMIAPLRDLAPVDALIPVSLHPKRRRERGYDQASLLTEALGKLTGVPVVACLERTKYTSPQVGQGTADRRTNMENAFRLRPDSPLATGCRVALVDDVRTTGATLGACATALLPLRPTFIGALTFAAAVPSSRGTVPRPS